jgi:hypothetical protein
VLTILPNDPLPDQEDLESYLHALSQGDPLLIEACGPVLREHSSVSCDLHVVLIYSKGPLNTAPSSLYEILIENEGYSNPGIGRFSTPTFPRHLGRLEKDWIMRGMFAPTFANVSGEMQYVANTEESVFYVSGATVYASFKYWIHQWYPAWYSGVGSPIGTFLEGDKKVLSHLRDQEKSSLWYLARLSGVDMRSFSDDKKYFERYALIPIEI